MILPALAATGTLGRMKYLLRIDSSARSGASGQTPHGSHTRRLTHLFVQRWQEARPRDVIVSRDVGLHPPAPVTEEWIRAAFTAPERRTARMNGALRESDTLVDELIQADVIVAGVPMYNFSVPAQFKAYIDNVVRVGRTFGFDRSRPGAPYWPLLTDKPRPLIVLSSRGDFGYDLGTNVSANHVEPTVCTAFAYIGIELVRSVAVEFDEFSDDRLQESLVLAERRVNEFVSELTREPDTP